jgi:FMN-dependent NADH-azoreductase
MDLNNKQRQVLSSIFTNPIPANILWQVTEYICDRLSSNLSVSELAASIAISPYHFACFDFHEPYLRTIFGSFGIKDVKFIYANNLALGDREKSIKDAKISIGSLAKKW